MAHRTPRTTRALLALLFTACTDGAAPVGDAALGQYDVVYEAEPETSTRFSTPVALTEGHASVDGLAIAGNAQGAHVSVHTGSYFGVFWSSLYAHMTP